MNEEIGRQLSELIRLMGGAATSLELKRVEGKVEDVEEKVERVEVKLTGNGEGLLSQVAVLKDRVARHEKVIYGLVAGLITQLFGVIYLLIDKLTK